MMLVVPRDVLAPESGGPYSCPCCGHLTLAELRAGDDAALFEDHSGTPTANV